jgi:hypothetical protein
MTTNLYGLHARESYIMIQHSRLYYFSFVLTVGSSFAFLIPFRAMHDSMFILLVVAGTVYNKGSFPELRIMTATASENEGTYHRRFVFPPFRLPEKRCLGCVKGE